MISGVFMSAAYRSAAKHTFVVGLTALEAHSPQRTWPVGAKDRARLQIVCYRADGSNALASRAWRKMPDSCRVSVLPSTWSWSKPSGASCRRISATLRRRHCRRPHRPPHRCPVDRTGAQPQHHCRRHPLQPRSIDRKADLGNVCWGPEAPRVVPARCANSRRLTDPQYRTFGGGRCRPI